MRDLVRGMESMDERARQQPRQQGPSQGQGQGQGQGQQGQGQGQGRAQSPGASGGGIGAGGGNQQGGGDRQFSREMSERIVDARALRDELSKQGMDVAPLDRAIQGMRTSERDGAFGDGPTATALRSQLIEGLKAYEFALRRALGEATGGKVLIGRSGEVPAQFRSQVEEYYKAIAKPAKAKTRSHLERRAARAAWSREISGTETPARGGEFCLPETPRLRAPAGRSARDDK